ncbi:hypothetical protein TKK_0001716 [Trichogramma kaykai]
MTKLGVYIFVLFLTTLSMIFGLLLFTHGFFLHKVAITQTNLCSDEVTTENKPDRLSAVQKCSKPRSRIVLLIIDALKFEFVEDFHDEASKNTFHRNKLPIISKLLGNKKDHSKLFKFIADPPTTTMQRLKSLTTGTLPTFIDVQNNFASDSIKEDNFVTQNKKNGNIFMGDDTWINLYPDTFLRAYPSPSFDVNDLDTVDLKVKDHIYHELANYDWTLLIAHMLGIDHCGHKHGMHHPEMSRKLNETNSFIEQLVKNIESDDKDTMLFIIGDHGMTESGDHGGDTVDEIETALFVYSTKPLIKVLNDSTKNSIKKVNQIDIVPTISLILGNAIPFSNLGNLIIEALPKNNFNKNSIQNDFNFIIDSLWKTIYQVQNYIDKYSSENYLSNKYQIDKLKSCYNNLLEKYRITTYFWKYREEQKHDLKEIFPINYVIVPKRKETLNIYSQETLVPKLFEKMKLEMYKKKEDDDDVAIIYGLGTVYSSSLLLLCVLFCIMNVLLLGFMISPCIFFMNIICIGLLFMNAIDRIQYSASIKELMHTPNHMVLCWFLLSEYFFYATGHQPIFSAIHWEAGFLGFDSSLELNKIRAILIGFNTFGSYIIFGLMLPLLIISPFTIKLIPVFAKLSTTSLYEPNKGEMEIYHNDRCFHLEIFSTAGRYILLHALRVFVCMLVATVHKRHLMVWKIFAPKLIFEGLGFMVTTASVTMSLLLLLRIENQIKKLVCKKL